jgi:hypothetical protein
MQNTEESEEEKEEREFQMFIRRQKKKRMEIGTRVTKLSQKNDTLFIG